MTSNGARNIPGAVYKRAKPEPPVLMAAFDVLPAEVRRALATATFDFDVLDIVDRMRHGMPTGNVLAAIKTMDAKLRARSDERFQQ